MSTLLTLSGVQHHYGRGTRAVAAVGPLDLHVNAGEFVVVVGPSGSGKSTLLRLIAGFEHPSTGTVELAGQPPVPGRDVGVVFQQPRLFPWRSVDGNINAALRWAGVPRADRAAASVDLLAKVGLSGLGARRVWEISGGQQQRVAIARALAARPRLLLLDEPFAALDALTRERLQEDVRTLTNRDGQGAVFVTHSVDEAVFLATRIIVLTDRPGRIAADIAVPLPRTGVPAAELRAWPEYAALRGQVAAAVRATLTEVEERV
ncbi:ABC transporter ATP-binding protein [Streptoalloteichus hindustanus]|uniref:Taurine transport system ATP-binding protein n=1 Tax=Streptoalloteichus hindustanus TaxID=2017 RepID=A0A1M5M5Y9_STRHI|nr:ATP-binding cassette domain-containing protein [Streptoalloteichus hindustanus]SHG72682.1 taurine transport system ATP-binding protein [Streptoalloteichus hindustanus]